MDSDRIEPKQIIDRGFSESYNYKKPSGLIRLNFTQ